MNWARGMFRIAVVVSIVPALIWVVGAGLFAYGFLGQVAISSSDTALARAWDAQQTPQGHFEFASLTLLGKIGLALQLASAAGLREDAEALERLSGLPEPQPLTTAEKIEISRATPPTSAPKPKVGQPQQPPTPTTDSRTEQLRSFLARTDQQEARAALGGQAVIDLSRKLYERAAAASAKLTVYNQREQLGEMLLGISSFCLILIFGMYSAGLWIARGFRSPAP